MKRNPNPARAKRLTDDDEKRIRRRILFDLEPSGAVCEQEGISRNRALIICGGSFSVGSHGSPERNLCGVRRR